VGELSLPEERGGGLLNELDAGTSDFRVDHMKDNWSGGGEEGGSGGEGRKIIL